MGYYTSYTLSCESTDGRPVDIISNFVETIGSYYGMNMVGETEPIKWYNHKTDLEKFSLQYPNTLFLLEGEGEEVGDIWKLYVKNGKSQLCKAIITFDVYDETKLN
jgi:hypothetical protein